MSIIINMARSHERPLKGISNPVTFTSLARLVLPPLVEGIVIGTVTRKLCEKSLEQARYELFKTKVNTELLIQKIGNALATGVDLGDTLDRIIDLASSILNADYGMIALLEQDQLRVVSSIGAPIIPPLIPVKNSVAGRALEIKLPAIVEDLRKTLHMASPARQIAGLRSVLAAPILRGGQKIGVIELYSSKPAAFSSENASVLFSFAKQAGVAIENARYIEQIKVEAEFRQTLTVITNSLLTAPSLSSLLFQLCKEATNLFNIDGTYIWRVDYEKNKLFALAGYGYKADVFLGRVVSIDDPNSMAARTTRERRTLVYNDIKPEEYMGEFFTTFMPRSQAAIPVVLGDKVEAVIIFNDRKNPFRFDTETVREAEILAGQAAIAISKTDLIDKLSRTEQVLTSTLNSVNEGILMVGRDLRILFVNGSASHLFDTDLSQFIGKNKPSDIIPLLRKRVKDPDGFERRLLYSYDHMAEELTDEVETIDGKILQRYGGPVYRDGELLGRIEVYRDITGAKQAQAELELRVRRSRAIAEIGRAASSSLELQEVLRTVIDQVCIALNVDAGSIFFYDESTGYLSGQIGYGFSDAEVRVIVEPVPAFGYAEEALRSHRPVIVENAQRDPRIRPEFVKRFNLKSSLALPLLVRDKPIGIIFLNTTGRFHRFTEDEVEFALGIATQAAVAIENARLFEAQLKISETLQKSLLPTAAPKVDDLDIGTSYISSTETALVGGDFYDFMVLPDGRFAFLIGDVSGKGIAAATITAMVKQSVRAFAIENSDPGSVMERTNRAAMWQLEIGQFVTVFYSVYNPTDGMLAYSNAGHPYPILVFEGTPTMLNGSNIALGVSESEKYKTFFHPFPPNATLALYTDGITESRHNSEFFGEERLTDILTNLSPLDAKHIVSGIIDEVKSFSSGRIIDDIALVVIKHAA